VRCGGLAIIVLPGKGHSWELGTPGDTCQCIYSWWLTVWHGVWRQRRLYVRLLSVCAIKIDPLSWPFFPLSEEHTLAYKHIATG
jgi:hypothetical protein